MDKDFAASRAIKNGWDGMSGDYQTLSEISTQDIHYSPFGPGEKQLGLIGDIQGKDFIELGCGAGQNSLAVASQGGNKVLGVDISGRQLKAAAHLADKTNQDIGLIQADVQNLDFIKSESFDVVMSMFALEFVSDLNRFFENCHRLLVNDGILILSTVHPLSAFEWDSETGTLLVDNYLNPPVELWGREDPDSINPATTFFRTIEEIVNSMLGAGFQIRTLLEPAALDKITAGVTPYGGAYWEPFFERFEKVPFALVIKASKVG